MSQETAAKVNLTAANLQEAEERARRAKEDALARIARELPDRVDALAKRYAKEQTAVATSLGREKLKEMRTELAGEANALGARFMEAIDEIPWPVGWDASSSSAVHKALFQRFHGNVNGPAEILERYGFKVRTGKDTSLAGAILPQYLYDANSFGDLAGLLRDLGDARSAHNAAVTADAQANVDDLWD